MKLKLSIISILLFAGLIWAVSAQEHNEAENAALIERGQEVFLTMGCTACHGQNAEGTSLAPALAGHSEFAVRRQLRAPIGIMPIYSPEMISAEDVDALVAYISSLEVVETSAGHEHEHAALAVGDISFAHHWLLYLAIVAENKDTALHEIEHISAYVEGAHLAQMDSLKAYVEASDFEAALVLAESMIADVVVFGEDSDFVYVQMIYRALLAEDGEAASHFISEALEHMVNHGGMGLLGEVETALEAEDFEAAAALLEAEYGESLLFETVYEAEATEEAHEHEEEPTEEAHEHEEEPTETPSEEAGGHEGH